MSIEPEKVRRTYFNHPLVVESLQCLPAALECQTPDQFHQYVVDHVPQNSLKGRKRIAGYLLQRFSSNGRLNMPLAAAVVQFGDSRISREILFFELVRVYPILHEIAIHWAAELRESGASRESLKEFLSARIPGKSAEKVAKDSLTTMKQCGKLDRPKMGWYRPVWAIPPVEVFLYALARLYPEPAMIPIRTLAAQPVFRAMLWPVSAVDELLVSAAQAGHVSKISRLDQYQQFTISESGTERLHRLLPRLPKESGPTSLFEPHTGTGG